MPNLLHEFKEFGYILTGANIYKCDKCKREWEIKERANDDEDDLRCFTALNA